VRTARERAREHAGTRGHAELRQQWACARLAQEQISHFDKPTGEKEGSPLLLAERAIGRDPDAKSNRLAKQTTVLQVTWPGKLAIKLDRRQLYVTQ
jgi:hypothetical protein